MHLVRIIRVGRRRFLQISKKDSKHYIHDNRLLRRELFCTNISINACQTKLSNLFMYDVHCTCINKIWRIDLIQLISFPGYNIMYLSKQTSYRMNRLWRDWCFYSINLYLNRIKF